MSSYIAKQSVTESWLWKKVFFKWPLRSHICRTCTLLIIWVLAAQWLERLTGHQKAVGSIPVWGSEIIFLRIELDDRSSIISRYLQALTLLLNYKFHHKLSFNKKKFSTSTVLSKFVWELKEPYTEYSIKWSIVEHTNTYKSGAKHCNLSLVGKNLNFKPGQEFTVEQKNWIADKVPTCDQILRYKSQATLRLFSLVIASERETQVTNF